MHDFKKKKMTGSVKNCVWVLSPGIEWNAVASFALRSFAHLDGCAQDDTRAGGGETAPIGKLAFPGKAKKDYGFRPTSSGR